MLKVITVIQWYIKYSKQQYQIELLSAPYSWTESVYLILWTSFEVCFWTMKFRQANKLLRIITIVQGGTKHIDHWKQYQLPIKSTTQVKQKLLLITRNQI